MKALLPAHHTGKRAAHAHTSYAQLIFLLVLVSLVLAAFTMLANAGEGDTSGGGSDGIFASVPAKVPAAPTIASPKSGVQVDNLPLEVSGSCSASSTVKILKNGVVAGAATCSAGGTYTIPVDLFFGNNSLVAQAFNIQDVASPSSPAVGVQFEPASGPLAGQFQLFRTSTAAANQLFIKADAFHQAVGSATTDWRMELVGGTPPYAVSVSWGDGKTDVYSRGQAGMLDLHHQYPSGSRNYDVVVKVSDSVGHTAYIQLVGVGAVAKPPTGGGVVGGFGIAWPLLGAAFLFVLAFWLGDRYEKYTLGKQKTV